MVKKNVPMDNIDEAELMQSLSVYSEQAAKGDYEVSAEEKSEDKPREERKKKKTKESFDYEKQFLAQPDKASQRGKSITIRPEFHDYLIRLLGVMGEDRIAVVGYLDNILAHHFECYADEIEEIFNKRNTLRIKSKNDD